MIFIHSILFLYIIIKIAVVNSLVMDEGCFREKSLVKLKETSKDQDLNFHNTLSNFKEKPFVLTVRYCLGKEGDATSREFVDCVSSMSTCPMTWHSKVNWEVCLCSGIRCAISSCLQYWLETFDFTNKKCMENCPQISFDCLIKQTGILPFKPTV